MSSALLPRCPSRGPHPALSFAATGGGDVRILPMQRRPARFGGVFCCSNSTSTPRAAVEKGPGFSDNFYEVLGIPQDGSFDEIKQAYKRMALKYHPDVSPPDCAAQYTQHFIEVKEAYETLSDPATRAIYDRNLAGGLHFTFSRRRGWDEKKESGSGNMGSRAGGRHGQPRSGNMGSRAGGRHGDACMFRGATVGDGF